VLIVVIPREGDRQSPITRILIESGTQLQEQFANCDENTGSGVSSRRRLRPSNGALALSVADTRIIDFGSLVLRKS
jgi:hypothetical protein